MLEIIYGVFVLQDVAGIPRLFLIVVRSCIICTLYVCYSTKWLEDEPYSSSNVWSNWSHYGKNLLINVTIPHSYAVMRQSYLYLSAANNIHLVMIKICTYIDRKSNLFLWCIVWSEVTSLSVSIGNRTYLSGKNAILALNLEGKIYTQTWVTQTHTGHI